MPAAPSCTNCAGPTKTPRAVRNGDEGSVTSNVTDNANHGQTAEPRGIRNQDHISVLYNNARNIIPKGDELLAYFATEEPGVIAITETWANYSHLMTEFSIEGYESFLNNRDHKKGGGVICCVQSPLSALEKDKQDAKNL